jgi:uncharacterized repeat protein (TIGR03803 family)
MLVSVVIALSLSATTAWAGNLLGNSFDGALYDVSPGSGVASNPRITGLSNLAGIAARSDGSLFGLTSVGGTPQPGALFQIDPNSGASTLIGLTGLSEIIEGDLAFNPATGTLYGIQEVDPSVNRGLFSINVSTCAATIIGNINAPNPNSDLSAMAFDSTGRLFVIDSTGTLLRVDPASGQVISAVALSTSLGATAGMAIDPSTGIVYVADGSQGGTNSLYTLNLSTGSLSLIGNTGLADGLAGLTFAGQAVPIPEPTSLLQGITAALAVGLFVDARSRTGRMAS